MIKTFDTRINCRFFSDQLKTIQKIVNANPEKYYSIGHFIRVAIIKEVRAHHK